MGEVAAVEFAAFLKVWRELPHPRAVLNDPGNADIPENASALMALCGSLYRLASDVTLDAIVTYATRLRRELGESLVGACVRREPALPALARLYPLGGGQDAVTEDAMTWRITHYAAGDAPSRDCAVRAPNVDIARRKLAAALAVPPVDAPVTRKENFMDLNRDAMLVGLHIAAWSGRLYDREASDHVAVAHEASASAGRYNKRPAAQGRLRRPHRHHERGAHEALRQLLALGRQGRAAAHRRQLRALHGADGRLSRARGAPARPLYRGLRRLRYVDQARLDLGRLFRIEDYPSKEDLQGKFAIRYRIAPVPDADHFIAKLASDDTERVKRDIERHVEAQLHDAVGDLYRRLGEAVERVSERLQEDPEGKRSGVPATR